MMDLDQDIHPIVYDLWSHRFVPNYSDYIRSPVRRPIPEREYERGLAVVDKELCLSREARGLPPVPEGADSQPQPAERANPLRPILGFFLVIMGGLALTQAPRGGKGGELQSYNSGCAIVIFIGVGILAGSFYFNLSSGAGGGFHLQESGENPEAHREAMIRALQTLRNEWRQYEGDGWTNITFQFHKSGGGGKLGAGTAGAQQAMLRIRVRGGMRWNEKQDEKDQLSFRLPPIQRGAKISVNRNSDYPSEVTKSRQRLLGAQDGV